MSGECPSGIHIPDDQENPVRAGYVRTPEDWTYSSAGVYYREAESAVPVAFIDW